MKLKIQAWSFFAVRFHCHIALGSNNKKASVLMIQAVTEMLPNWILVCSSYKHQGLDDLWWSAYRDGFGIKYRRWLSFRPSLIIPMVEINYNLKKKCTIVSGICCSCQSWLWLYKIAWNSFGVWIPFNHFLWWSLILLLCMTSNIVQVGQLEN